MHGSRKIKPLWKPITVALVLPAGVSISAADRQSSVQLERTAIHFTLASVLHAVHGTFCLKHGAWRLAPASGRLTGEIGVDTQNGESGKRNAGAENAGHEESQHIVSSASESVEIDLGIGGEVTQ
jgi:hypothetical protein